MERLTMLAFTCLLLATGFAQEKTKDTKAESYIRSTEKWKL
jgi:hypothetical protein